jgi:hypothetical protein
LLFFLGADAFSWISVFAAFGYNSFARPLLPVCEGRNPTALRVPPIHSGEVL